MITRKAAAALAAQYHVSHTAIEDHDLDEGAFDHTVTDPPYAKRTQDNIRHGKKGKRGHRGISAPTTLAFDPADAEKRRRWARTIARVTRRWALVFSDHESSVDWGLALELAGLVYIRSAIWVRTWDVEIGPERPTQSGAPQFTGDRPGSGHEVIVCAHHPDRRLKWRGRGQHGVYTSPVMRGEDRVHDNQKPLALIDEILRDFCDPGESVFDPFCGAGTVSVAGKNLGVGVVAGDFDGKWADYTRRRVAAAKTSTR